MQGYFVVEMLFSEHSSLRNTNISKFTLLFLRASLCAGRARRAAFTRGCHPAVGRTTASLPRSTCRWRRAEEESCGVSVSSHQALAAGHARNGYLHLQLLQRLGLMRRSAAAVPSTPPTPTHPNLPISPGSLPNCNFRFWFFPFFPFSFVLEYV